MTQTAERLKRNPDLAELTDEEARKLIERATRLEFGKGDVLMTEGEVGQAMILLDSGKVEVRRGETTLASLGEGSTIGEMALLDPAPRSATVVATTKVVAFAVERDTVWAMLAEGDSAAIKVLQGLTTTVCGRLADVNRLVQEEVIRPKGNVFSRIWKKVARRS